MIAFLQIHLSLVQTEVAFQVLTNALHACSIVRILEDVLDQEMIATF